MSKVFREIDKEDVSIQAPRDIAREIRVEAAKRGTSISKLGSEALIVFLGRNPRDYGIERTKTAKQTAQPESETMTQTEYSHLKGLLVQGCAPERYALLVAMTPKQRQEFTRGLTLSACDHAVTETWKMLAILLAQDSRDQPERIDELEAEAAPAKEKGIAA